MNEVDVKDLVSVYIHGFLHRVADLAKIWIRELQSMKLVKVQTVHNYIMSDTQLEYSPYSHILYQFLREVGVVNLAVLLFVCWSCSNFHLQCYFFYDWMWRTFVKIIYLQRKSPFAKWTFHAPSSITLMWDQGRLSCPFSSGSGPQIETLTTHMWQYLAFQHWSSVL